MVRSSAPGAAHRHNDFAGVETLPDVISSARSTGPPSGSSAQFHRDRAGWAFLVFAVAIALAYSPAVLNVFSVLSDFDALALKSEHFFFHNEAVHLVSIARPITALLSNLPVLFVQAPEDFRWFRLFSLLTVGVLGWLMIRTCTARLHTSAWDAAMVALATFLGLAFIYAVVESTAWAPHLLAPLLAFVGYSVLSRSNMRMLSFPGYVAQRDYRALPGQLMAYCLVRPVWIACLIYQCALYTYPPHALLVVLFPAIAVLFSRAPPTYRSVIAVRDVLFIGANLVFFSLSTALIYLPIVRLFTAKGSGSAGAYKSEYVANLYAGHQFAYNTDVLAIARRFGHLLTVSADLWFLPQTNTHIVTAIVIALAALVTCLKGRPGTGRRPLPEVRSGIVAVLVLVICLVLTALPILASAGGFVAYRTSVATTALIAVIFVFAMRTNIEWLCERLGGSPVVAARAGAITMAFVVGAAFAANVYANYAVMKLGRNEYAYFIRIVRQTVDSKSKAIILIDPRPWGGAQGYNPWPVFDEKGRAVPPFELACFSSFCMQTGAIVRVIARALGRPDKAYELVLTRGDEPIPGLTCEMLEGPAASYPASTSRQAIQLVDRYRSLAPLTCVTANMGWHDLGLDLRH
ncbi:MAG: hypothetical protein J0J01_22045 [Reyranella sp.]|nr:hypothetical protein [Reyranella sp.]